MSNESTPEKPGPKYGPARAAPKFYAGETYGSRKIMTARGLAYAPRPIQYPDVERYPNGALPSKRNKFARRLIRAQLKETFSSLTKPLRLARGLRAQAYDVARESKKSTRFARRLLAAELAIHQPVYVPTQKELRAMRTAARAAKRKGTSVDPIADVVDMFNKDVP